MAAWVLFGTEGCHLCEEAEQLLYAEAIDFDKQDIANDELSLQRYGIRIPVLWHPESNRELDWPFSAEQLRGFLHAAETKID